MKVRVDDVGAALKNLLPWQLARTWTDRATERLGLTAGGELGVVLQAAGPPVRGFVHELAGGDWRELAAEHLLTTVEPIEGAAKQAGPDRN